MKTKTKSNRRRAAAEPLRPTGAKARVAKFLLKGTFSVGSIAKKTETSEANVRAHIRQLEERGLKVERLENGKVKLEADAGTLFASA